MIFEPEYAGVCSWRIVALPCVKTSDALSGDQLTPEIAPSSDRATSDSRPSFNDRVHNSLPTAAACARTNATRDPSGDGTMADSACGIVQIAAAALPSIGTRQRSPFFGSISARPSALQNAPASDAPPSGSSRGFADPPAASATYTFET